MANLLNPNQQIVDWSKENAAARDKLLGGQQQQFSTLYGKYQSAVNPLQGQIGNINKQIGDVQSMLSNLDTNIGSQTKGTWTSQAQRDRLKAYQAKPLTEELANLGTAAAPLNEQLSNVRGDYGMQIQQQSDYFARQITGFDHSSQNELSGLVAKIQRNEAISDQQWQRANQLADQESSFQHQMALAKVQLQASTAQNSMFSDYLRSLTGKGGTTENSTSNSMAGNPPDISKMGSTSAFKTLAKYGITGKQAADIVNNSKVEPLSRWEQGLVGQTPPGYNGLWGFIKQATGF